MADQLEIVKKGHLTHDPVGKTHFRPVTSSPLIHAHSVHWEEGAMKARLRAREEYEAMRKECGSKVRPEVAEAQHAAVYATVASSFGSTCDAWALRTVCCTSAFTCSRHGATCPYHDSLQREVEDDMWM